MSLSRIVIKNFKSIKECDIAVTELNVFIGENGAGKSNLLDAIRYFYANLTDSAENESYFDENNRYSNEIRITLFFDLSELIKIANKNLGREFVLRISKQAAKTKYIGYYRKILTLATKAKTGRLLRVEMQQVKGRGIHWNYGYDERAVIKSLFPLYAVDTRNLDLDSWNYIWNVLAEISKVSNDERKVLHQEIRNILLADKKETAEKAKVIEALLAEADISIKKDSSREFAKGCFILSGIDTKGLLQAVDTAVDMVKNGDNGIPVPDYVDENVSDKVVKIIQSYVGVVNKMVWRKF